MVQMCVWGGGVGVWGGEERGGSAGFYLMDVHMGMNKILLLWAFIY